MSNKTQILCNLNNKHQTRIMKYSWQRIHYDQIELEKTKIEEQELHKIIDNKGRAKPRQNASKEVIKVVKLQDHIQFLEERITVTREWIKHKEHKLVIC